MDYHRSINMNGEIEKLKTFITNEVVFNQQQVDEYLDQWKPFKSLWEMDKDLFMKKFNEIQIAAKSYEKNFTRYAEIENQVLLQESMVVIQFVEINANQLKNSIFAHIDDWRERHKVTLRKSGYHQISGSFFLTENEDVVELSMIFSPLQVCDEQCENNFKTTQQSEGNARISQLIQSSL